MVIYVCNRENNNVQYFILNYCVTHYWRCISSIVKGILKVFKLQVLFLNTLKKNLAKG